MKRVQSVLLSSVLVASLLSFSFGWFFGKNLQTDASEKSPPGTTFETPPQTANETIKIPDIDEVWNRLQKTYYDASKLDLENLQWGAVKGFVEGMEDPYTVFMTPEESDEFADGLEGNLEGIGAELEVKNGKLIVVSPLKNSPAQKAGIKSGDMIYKINNELAEEMTLFEAIKRIRGKKGTKVMLTIIRDEEPKPLEITITRDDIEVESIKLEKLENDIFHLSISQFSDKTKKEYENAVQQILLEKARGLIIDLRGNGGGYLDISIDILSELFQGKKIVVIIKKRNPDENERLETTGSGRIADIPLVVLVDKGSASASEIVAGAVQDYKRGVLIGEKTFGKGSVQELSELPDGANLRFTIAKWFTPLDRSIDDVGITPDKEVKLTEEDLKADRDPQLEEAINYLTQKKR